MADNTGLHVDIISPERPLFSGDAVSVVAPNHDGEVGILAHHAPMVSQLGVGEVRITRNTAGGTRTDYYAVHNGFLQTVKNKVIIITEEAKGPDDIDEFKVKAAIEEAEKTLATAKGEERVKLNERLRWLRTQDRVVRHKLKGMAHHGALERSGLTMTMDKAEADLRRQQQDKK